MMKNRLSEPAAASLWGNMFDYDFWRAVSASISARGHDIDAESGTERRFADVIEAVADDCFAAGEIEISCLLACLAAQVNIDVHRDFRRGCEVSAKASEFAKRTTDARVLAYAYDTHGDALRCSGRDDEAIVGYLRALEVWPSSGLQDRAETLLMRGISEAKLGRFREATKSALSAAKLHSQPDAGMDCVTARLAEARCRLEACCVLRSWARLLEVCPLPDHGPRAAEGRPSESIGMGCIGANRLVASE